MGQQPESMVFWSASFYWQYIFVTALFSLVYSKWSRVQVVSLPIVGHSGFVSSYFTGLEFLIDARRLMHEGYGKHKNGAFKIASLTRWNVVLSGKALIEEYRQAADDTFSLDEVANEVFAVKYTLGPSVAQDHYHVGVVRGNLNRHLPAVLEELADEIPHVFKQLIGVEELDEPVQVPMLDIAQQIVARCSARAFVGIPVCRNSDYINVAIKFTMDMVYTAMIITRFPDFMKPLVVSLVSRVPKATNRAQKHLGPIIEERLRMSEKYGKDWPGKPNDMLTWLMEEASGEERTTRALTLRMLILNFASIHQTSMMLTHVLYNIASHPEYIKTMREEADLMIAQHGWTKNALSKMHKIDSFVKETHRLHATGALAMNRISGKPFTFSNGTFLPKGTGVFVAVEPIHIDDENYPDGSSFKPFRFAEMFTSEEDAMKNSSASTGLTYLGFGHGRHACPGRFFAMHEIKAILAYVLLEYDITVPGGVRPQDKYYGYNCVPNTTAKVSFQRRKL